MKPGRGREITIVWYHQKVKMCRERVIHQSKQKISAYYGPIIVPGMGDTVIKIRPTADSKLARKNK